ncbi:Isonitrile hydratase [Saezia sanguinis]|uniref:Isonitrile hydratase n=1 Tax=Saezia sanguinis TaxID=1965230 RepID=A0A433S9U9_9BURK|nr:DJ-1/PfpI family protein [Saezia sanguinis]RUS65444.1 Isonitrile hydratase [Saezia sanguinis]
MHINIFLFNDFETLDAFGPVEVLGRVDSYQLHYCSLPGGLVTSRQQVPVVTVPVSQVDQDGVLLIPGGQGTRPLVSDEQAISALKNLAAKSAYCLSVCTGSALLAKTGLLSGRVATSNKKAWPWVTSVDQAVLWKRQARWCVDGKFYTSSGVSAGMDMTLGFIADQHGMNKANDIAQHIEYVWNANPDNDPFAG